MNPPITTHRSLSRWLLSDPRNYQILVLSCLLVYGVLALHFEVRPADALVIATAALVTQWAGSRFARQPFEVRSACISTLSLCLLLRTSHLGFAALAAALAIGSKFLLRFDGKHVWNPTNFGIVLLLLTSHGQVWVSPGQWGSTSFLAFFLLCCGGLVVYRAARADVTWAFLLAYGGLLVGRALWLGQPMTIPLHQVSSGAFLIFSFFMISDPKTTPDSRPGRVVFAVLVVAATGWAQFVLFRPTAMLLALACLAPAVPVLNFLFPGDLYRWPRPAAVERSFA